jgi:predicted nucleic-acid-binding protein
LTGSVVLAETVWVLESAYGMNRNDIALARLLPELLLQDHAPVRAALEAFAKTSVGFTDLLIAEVNRANGCDTTTIFDRKAAKLEGFTRVP